MRIHQFLQSQLKQNSAVVAIKDADGEITYQELNSKVNQFANYLRKQGVQPEVLVGIYAERSIELVIAILAVLQAGGAYIPLDPAYPKDRLASIITDTKLGLILTQSHLAPDLTNPELNLFLLDTEWARVEVESVELVPAVTTPDNLAYIMYTSGSTGKPQGVQITISQVECYLQAINEFVKIQPDDIYLHSASFSFSSSIRQLLLPLAHGAKVVITSKENITNLFSLIELICREQITIFDTVASVWNYISIVLADLEKDRQSPLMNSQIRLLLFSGGLLTSQLLDRVQRKFPQPPQIVNIYGQTETIGVCVYPIPDNFNASDGYVPVGSAYSHNQLYVLDDRLEPVATAQTGELYVSGASLARGYLNNPQLNAQKFIPNPFSRDKPPTLLYKTGDLARYLPDGNLEIVGRQDFQVKIRGMRVEVEEIETVLMQYPDVQQAAVVGKENQAGEQIIVAYIVTNNLQNSSSSNNKIDLNNLRLFLKTKLTDYMMPSAFEILDALPLTPNHKLDRRRLPEPSREHSIVVPARDDLELKLIELWEKVLGVKSMGITDNFFELGGNSLVALQLFAQIEQVWKKRLFLSTLFESPTIAELAETIRKPIDHNIWSPLVLLKPGDDSPPLFCVHPIGGNLFNYYKLSKELQINRPIYGLQARGINSKQQPFDRIEDMASYFIQSIQTVQPDGPYFLIGYSFGGIIAFEIARQLAWTGKTVSFLGLLDVRCPTMEKPKIPLLQSIRTQVAKIVKLTPAEQFDFWTNNMFHPKSIRYRREVAATLSNLDLSNPELLNILDCNLQARNDYQPQVYPGTASLFWTEYQDEYIDRYPTLGWGDLVAGGIDVQATPGNHDTMVQEPHVRVLAEKLRLCMEG